MATGTGYLPSRQGQCAHVYGHCATLFSNPSCNYYWAGDCQARRAKDVPITMASRTQSPILTPRFLQRGGHFVQITLAVEIWISLFSFHFLGAAEVWSQSHLPSPQLHPWVLSLYLETITMKQEGMQSLEGMNSPLALFAEFCIFPPRIITLGNLESHFLINNFCLCGQNK